MIELFDNPFFTGSSYGKFFNDLNGDKHYEKLPPNEKRSYLERRVKQIARWEGYDDPSSNPRKYKEYLLILHFLKMVSV